MFIFTDLPAWLTLFLQWRRIDAKEEQSHHGDEVISSLSYKDEKDRKPRMKIKEEEKIESFYPLHKIQHTHLLYLHPRYFTYYILYFCLPAFKSSTVCLSLSTDVKCSAQDAIIKDNSLASVEKTK